MIPECTLRLESAVLATRPGGSEIASPSPAVAPPALAPSPAYLPNRSSSGGSGSGSGSGIERLDGFWNNALKAINTEKNASVVLHPDSQLSFLLSSSSHSV